MIYYLKDTKKKKKKKSIDLDSLSKVQVKTAKDIKDSIKYVSDDYLVVKINNKFELGTAIGKGKLLLERGVEDDETSQQLGFQPEDVCANLGKSVQRGTSVFGITINPYEFTINNENWGKIHFYRSMDDARELKYFHKVMDTAFEKLSELKATGFLPLTIKVYNAKGKKVGWYKSAKKGDEIGLQPIDWKDKEYCSYVVMHEAAHGIWTHQVPKDIQVLWIDAYEDRIKVQSADKKKLERLGKEAAECAEGIGFYMKNECDGEDADTVKEALAYVKRVHKISTKQLEMYIQQIGSKSILKFWPNTTDIGKTIEDISEYSMKSFEEFFAEAFAFHMTGKKLPKDVRKLLKKTMKNLVKDYG